MAGQYQDEDFSRSNFSSLRFQKGAGGPGRQKAQYE